MLLKIMGLLDFLSAAALILVHFNVIGFGVALLFAAYLLSKGVIFRGDIVSLIDFVIGVYILFIAALSIQIFVTFILAAYLIQKTIFSLF